MKRIIVRMRGGLGNQLFIVAHAYYLAKNIKDEEYEIVLDLREYDTYKVRKFELLDILRNEHIRVFDVNDRSIFYDVSRNSYKVFQALTKDDGRFLSLTSKIGLVYSQRKAHGYSIPDKVKTIYAYGYFQDILMVEQVREILLSDITLPNAGQRDKHTISVSVRCGKDYICSGWPMCSASYYKNAIEELVGQYHNKEVDVLVFSDDIDTARNMELSPRVIYVENKTSAEQLSMMAMCDDFILSNSSFAWWGAMIGRKKHSKIIMPDQWYDTGEKTRDTWLCFDNAEVKSMK